MTKNTSKETVHFRDIRWFSYGESDEGGEVKEHPNEVWFR